MVTLDMNTILAVAAVVGIVVGAATLYQITKTHLIHDALAALRLGSKILRVVGLQLRAVAKEYVVKIKNPNPCGAWNRDSPMVQIRKGGTRCT